MGLIRSPSSIHMGERPSQSAVGTSFGPSLAAASLDGCFDHPAMKTGKSTAGMRRQSMLGRENVVNEAVGDLMELR